MGSVPNCPLQWWENVTCATKIVTIIPMIAQTETVKLRTMYEATRYIQYNDIVRCSVIEKRVCWLNHINLFY